MASFSSFQNILPDPNNEIGDAGQVSGTAGPGFASVSISSEQKTLRDRTNSGRILARAKTGHKWNIKIKYNPMTRADFEPVYNFLLHRRGALNPFFVSLPQYRTPQDSTFATFSATAVNKLQSSAALVAAGATSLTMYKTGYSYTANGTPRPGDLFTVNGANSNHKKAYMVNRVETYDDYLGSAQPSTNQVRVHFTPGLSRSVVGNDDFIFHNPLIKVIMTTDIQEYSLNTNNLYSFSLSLEEVQ